MPDFKPMLASPAPDFDKIRFPVYASPKLDGIRCVIRNGQALTRMLKPIPNDHIRYTLESYADLEGMDGEIVTFGPDGKDEDFNTIQGNVMRKAGKPRFNFWVFDNFKFPTYPYLLRVPENVNRTFEDSKSTTSYLWHRKVRNVAELVEVCQRHVDAGYEGTMIRDPAGSYKFGRSTAKEQGLLKIKRFFDAEATVIGFSELMRNGNEAQKDNLGRTKRSSCKENLIPAGIMGTMCVELRDDTQIKFDIGTGFTDTQRHNYWVQRKSLIGKTVTFKYQEISKYGVPRFPVFLGFRYDLD